MKTFKQYLSETESLRQVAEDSNLPSANDSQSPINGNNIDFSASEKLQRRRKNVKTDTDNNRESRSH